MSTKKSSENIKNLESLKTDYDKGLVSALIGAGFSRNVSNLYMDWNTLLEDLINDLFKLEINQYIDNYFNCNKKKYNNTEEEAIKKEFTNNILNKYGYLGIVSMYITQKGYREVIEDYIEDRTPYAKKDNDNGTMSLYIKENKKTDLKESDFSAHKKLLLCDKFKNIYTTNYDNLLEFTSKELSKDPTPLVSTSWQLSNGFQERSIIKIHGSLRIEDDKFEFDGDQHLRYIIAQEDYDTYIEKHEAFSHLMRISMLQGKFCLLGFSGNDPNYMGWVKWICDILYKGTNKEPKIYLVTFKNEQNSDKKLYYKNHYIKEINLMDYDVLSLIGYEPLESLKSLSRDSPSYKEVLGCFFDYLHKTSIPIEEENETLVNHISQQNKDDKEPKKENHHIEYTNSFDYRKLWSEAENILYKQEDLSQIYQKISKAKKYNRFCKSVQNQQSCINIILYKKGNLSYSEANLFVLGIKECGQLPHYYSRYLDDKPILNNIPLWGELLEREKTLNGCKDTLPIESDVNIYENIQRKMFHLDFKGAKSLLDTWEPEGYWILSKTMRIIGYEKSNKLNTPLTDYINKIKDPQEKMYACVMANYISNTYPNPYNLDNYLRKHIYGQGDIINYIVDQLKSKEKEPRKRGWIGSTLYLNSNNTIYEQSLRCLQFIFDSGLFLSSGITYFMNIKDWYKVCKNLYKYFPYPCFFYSIQYNNQETQERIGQDFAFTPDLLETNKELLVAAINAYGNSYTPNIFLPGILNIAGPLYLCVEETLWFDSFRRNIFDVMITYLPDLTYQDQIVRNIIYAISALKIKEHISILLESLFFHFKNNCELVTSIICNNIHLNYLKGKLNRTCTNLLKELIDEYPQIDITEIIYFFNENNCLPASLLKMFIEKLKQSKPEAIPAEASSIFYICILAKDEIEIIKKAKQKLLEKDIWHCGVSLDGTEWTAPNYIHIHVFDRIIKWDDNEFNIIYRNLKLNIDKYEIYAKDLHKDSFMQNIQVSYLSDILQFISLQESKRQNMLKDIKCRVEKLLKERVSYNSFIEAMLSKQPSEVSNGIDNIAQGILASGLKLYYNEINFIIDRAIMGEEVAMAKNLSIIQWLINKYEQEFSNMNIDPKLLILLSVYKENWQNISEFRPDLSFEVLNTIAKYLNRKKINNKNVEYWLTNKYVKIFLHD
ncbi:SIR2 family protein [Fusobacterium nucleatum]